MAAAAGGIGGESSDSEDEASFLHPSPAPKPVASSVPELVERSRATVALIASLRQSNSELKGKLKGVRSKTATCMNDFMRQWQQVDSTKQELSSSIENLDHEQRQLRDLSNQQSSEHELVMGRLAEKREQRALFDARIQVLMERLVLLLSTATDSDCAQMSDQLVEELQGSSGRLQGKLDELKAQLEQIRGDNRKLAVRLSEEQLVTKRLHDEFCKLQGDLFQRRSSGASGSQPSRRTASLGRAVPPASDLMPRSSSAAGGALPKMATVAEGEEDGDAVAAGMTNAGAEPDRRPAQDAPHGRDRTQAMEKMLCEVLEAACFADPVVRISAGVYDFGQKRSYVRFVGEEVFASHDKINYEPIKAFVMNLAGACGSSASQKIVAHRAVEGADAVFSKLKDSDGKATPRGREEAKAQADHEKALRYHEKVSPRPSAAKAEKPSANPKLEAEVETTTPRSRAASGVEPNPAETETAAVAPHQRTGPGGPTSTNGDGGKLATSSAAAAGSLRARSPGGYTSTPSLPPAPPVTVAPKASVSQPCLPPAMAISTNGVASSAGREGVPRPVVARVAPAPDASTAPQMRLGWADRTRNPQRPVSPSAITPRTVSPRAFSPPAQLVPAPSPRTTNMVASPVRRAQRPTRVVACGSVPPPMAGCEPPPIPIVVPHVQDAAKLAHGHDRLQLRRMSSPPTPVGAVAAVALSGGGSLTLPCGPLTPRQIASAQNGAAPGPILVQGAAGVGRCMSPRPPPQPFASRLVRAVQASPMPRSGS